MVYSAVGIFASVLLLVPSIWLAIAIARWAAGMSTSTFEVITIAGGLTFVAALFLPAIQSTRPASPRLACANNLKQITLGMHHYNDTYKRLPFAYVMSSSEQPLHSWRVGLTPFVEGGYLLPDYDFDLPWNSEHNFKLASSCPVVNRCPASRSELVGDTQYFTIVGDETPWPRSTQKTFQDVLDGTSNTMAFVESHGRKVKWIEPRDLTFSRMSWNVNAKTDKPQISSKHAHGSMVSMMDGSVKYINEGIDDVTLRALSTAAGGEAVKDF